MAEPARRTGRQWAPERDVSVTELPVLQRWVELPDGRFELLELPLTPELFLDPELDDKMVQGGLHDILCREMTDILERYLRRQPDVVVVHDMKHLFRRDLSKPAPDISVSRGARGSRSRESFDVLKEGAVPFLVIEVVSPALRHIDLQDKVALYQKTGIREYVIVDQPRKRAVPLYTLLGYRLDAAGRYQPIEPDAEGRILSETTGLWFQIAPTGDRVLFFEAATGRRLLSSLEEEARADRETEARVAAETEVGRLRAEIERLRGGG